MEITDMLAVFAVAVLAGLGVGSGGLLVVYLTFFRDYGQLEAQAVNLRFFIFAALASLLYHLTKSRVDKKALFLLAVFGCAGAFAGSAVAVTAKPEFLKISFGMLLVAAGVFSLAALVKEKKTQKSSGSKQKDDTERPKNKM